MNPGAKDHSLQSQSFVRTDDCPKRYLHFNPTVPDSNNVVHLNGSTDLGRLGTLWTLMIFALPTSVPRQTFTRLHVRFT